ncbi:MAG: N-acetylmuramoyl-L-alanine amidase [Candidatus Aminicenantes bacterium]|nr:N-acetylmuramoyl-L-alanine amidase [Candidatus Aminicenantes bacterium]
MKPKTVLLLFLAPLLFALPAITGQDPRAEIVNLRYHTHANFTRIVLDIGRLREYVAGEAPSPGRIYVDVLQARLNPILQDASFPVKSAYLSQILVFQKSASTVRISAEVDFARLDSYRVFHLFDPFRVVIDIYPKLGPAPVSGPDAKTGGTTPAQEKPPAAEKPAVQTPPPEAAKTKAKPPTQPPARTAEKPAVKGAPEAKKGQPPDPLASGYSLARQLGLGVKTIVLDPGHGGAQPGCVGKSGLLEKDVVLDIALELKQVLIARGFDVILTRESDVAIPIEDRPVIAQRRADIFISIHANASPNRRREGVETFYLNFSTDPAVNEIAARENATSTKNISLLTEIIKKIVQNSKIPESQALAENVHKNLLRTLSDKDRPMKSLGVKGGPFWVLIGGDMPSILVEVSHLSNSREEGLLKTPGWKSRIVRGLADGIMDYVRSLGKG